MKVHTKITGVVVGVALLVFATGGTALAHVVVRPGDAKTGAYQTFTVSVPVEKNNPTISIKLDIPEGVVSVKPTVKPGWAIQTAKEGDDEDAKITAITWSGNKIDVGYRDEFTFSAKTPDQPVDLAWKAYQTYQDGSVVSWDQPTGSEEDETGTTGPFSVTRVKADTDQDIALKNADSKAVAAQANAEKGFYVSLGAIALAVVALIVAGLAVMRKPKTAL